MMRPDLSRLVEDTRISGRVVLASRRELHEQIHQKDDREDVLLWVLDFDNPP